ncbi:hypothetical protein Pint_14503 [Pistacia integerrima]|uniref:Uncharacterized protein n=1 Tax=Pistacia integerrima TaxID=434235 RepID=A0ACC0YA68_9ROSI|nr:hypothetical protein Pint_14503 [Pistacia integerrima]
MQLQRNKSVKLSMLFLVRDRKDKGVCRGAKWHHFAVGPPQCYEYSFWLWSNRVRLLPTIWIWTRIRVINTITTTIARCFHRDLPNRSIVLKLVAKSNLKPVTLELGGNHLL